MAIHVAYITLLPVNEVGAVVNKDIATIKQMLTASTQMRVLFNATYAPNANGNPTIEEYLTREASAGYTNIRHISQTLIVTTT